MDAVFLAADALVARHLASHPHHGWAKRCWARLAAERPPLATTPAMLDAAATELARAADPAFAAERLRRWSASPSLQVVVPDADDRHRALGWLERWRDPGVDMADCCAWAVMERLRIATACTRREPYRWAGHRLLG